MAGLQHEASCRRFVTGLSGPTATLPRVLHLRAAQPALRSKSDGEPGGAPSSPAPTKEPPMPRAALALVVLVVVALPAAVFAQSAGSSGIEGTVTDASGGVLPGAAVVVKSEETGIARETVTDNAGR